MVFNDSIYFQGSIQDCKTIEFEAPVCQSNTLIIQHYDKKFGENGQWDTRSNGGEITHDRAVKMISLKLDDVDVTKYLVDNCPLITQDDQTVFTDYWGYNGTVKFDFQSPVYDWIICNIVKPKTKDLTTLSIETSRNNLFNYHQDEIEIKEIETLLDTYAYLFNKSTKI